MQGLENNTWIFLDPLGNIDEIHTNLTVMTFSILTTFELKKLNYV